MRNFFLTHSRSRYVMLLIFLFSIFNLQDILAKFSAISPPIIKINQGVFTTSKIALVGIKDYSNNDISRASSISTIVSIVENDLASTALFSVLPNRAHPDNITNSQTIPTYNIWKSAGILFLGVINISQISDNSITAILKLYDIVSGVRIGEFSFKSSLNNIRLIAHSISDAIFSQVVGDDGYFTSKIAYVSEETKTLNIGRKRDTKNVKVNSKLLKIMDIDGHNDSYILNNTLSGISLSPRLSPDNKYLTYFSYEKAFSKIRKKMVPVRGRIYVVNLANKNIRIITIPGLQYAPRFSNDGSKIIFSISKNGSSCLYTYNLITKTIKQLTTPIGRSIDTSPCFSNDDTKIVFNSDRCGSQQLFIMDANASSPSTANIRRISFDPNGRYATPVWSPRGDLIAFTKINSYGFHIGVMKHDGSSANERIIASGYVVEAPSWTKNGRVIYYTKKPSSSSPNCIYCIDITGLGERVVKRNASAPHLSR